MEKFESGGEKFKIKEVGDPADWYMMHELISLPLSFCLHPYLRKMNLHYFPSNKRFTVNPKS